MPPVGFYPHCFAAPGWEADECPHCHTDLGACSRQPYTSRLIHALSHPLAKVRMRAIITPGLQGATGHQCTARGEPGYGTHRCKHLRPASING